MQTEITFQVVNDLQSANTSLRALAINTTKEFSSIQWFVKGAAIGSSDSIYIDLNDFQPGDLELLVTNDFGCTDTATFNKEQSPDPIFDNFTLCKAQQAIIKANNTTDLYFYADEALTQFLGKGSQLVLAGANVNTSVYAVNVTNVIPSRVVKVPIQVSALEADFLLTKDTINLAFDNNITLSATVSSAISWQWDLGNGTTKTGTSVLT